MGDRYVKPNENKKILYIDANNLCGWAMNESLPYDQIKFDKKVEIEVILKTPEYSNFGYMLEVDLIYPDFKKRRTKNFPFGPQNKKNDSDNFTTYLDENKPKTYTQNEKLKCDWTDKKERNNSLKDVEFLF